MSCSRSSRDPLTPRQRQIVELIEAGRTTGAIARDLFLAPSTVKTHVRDAMDRVGAHTRAELVTKARV